MINISFAGSGLPNRNEAIEPTVRLGVGKSNSTDFFNKPKELYVIKPLGESESSHLENLFTKGKYEEFEIPGLTKKQMDITGTLKTIHFLNVDGKIYARIREVDSGEIEFYPIEPPKTNEFLKTNKYKENIIQYPDGILVSEKS